MELFDHIRTIARNRKTYAVGLLQSRAYRALKQQTAILLKEDGLTPVEWSMIGIIGDRPASICASDIALILGVKAPLVSRLIKRLHAGGWIDIVKSGDKRQRFLVLTSHGNKMLDTIEKRLHVGMRPLLRGVKAKDLLGYLHTLEAIEGNTRGMPEASFKEYLPD